MKLEYLPDGAPECPLVRLFEFDGPEACQIHQVFVDLAASATMKIALHELPFVHPVAGCELTLETGTADVGVRVLTPPAQFKYALSKESWQDNAGLVEPLCHPDSCRGFQWLAGQSDIAVLLSVVGKW